MRKIYSALLSLFTILLFSSKSDAQVNLYIFAQTSGTYTEITGGTVLGSATSDDERFVNPAVPLGGTAATGPGFPIGFNFPFNGNTFDRFAVNNNGWISLGQSALTPSVDINSSSAYTPLASTATNTPAILRNRIAGLGRDLQAQAGSEIRFETIGTSPTMQLVVQFKNYKRFGSAAVGDNFNFQIRLHESGLVQVVYGTFTFNTTTTSSTTNHLGLGGSVATDFNNRATTDPHNWNATIAGASNTAGIQNPTSSIAITGPTSGLTFTWLPPPPCVNPMNGGTTQASVASACAAIPFTLSVTGASIGTGITLEWQSSTDGVAWGPAGGTGATLNVTQATTMWYRRKMTCSGVDAFSTPLQVTMSAPNQCYCPITFPSNVEPITLVNFSTINNVTSPALNGTPALENFTSIVANVNKGQVYPMTVKGNTDGNFTTIVTAYVDWNQDGDFDDAGETYPIGNIVNSTGTDAVQAVGNISIPVTALDGQTRMRVTKKFNTAAAPCNNAGFGQAEDYTLNVVTPLCSAPTGVSVGTVTATSATVTFTATGTAYVEYGPPGFTPGTGATAGAGTVISGASPLVIPGLTPNTDYQVYVRQDCGGGIFSSNVSGGTIHTLCLSINTFPYTETFEAASLTRPCWSNQQVSGGVAWTYGAGAGNGGTVTTAHGGTVNARHFGSNSGSVARFVSPVLDLTSMPAQGAQVRFWFANQEWFGDQNELRVYYRTSLAGAWTLVPGGVYTSSVGAWTEAELILPSSTGSEYQIAFEGIELFGRGVAIDDVTIEAAPSCPKPTQVSALAITPTSVLVSFTSPGTGFIVEYGAPGFTPGTGNTAGTGGTLVLGASSPITVTGLTAGTAYDFHVRRVCIPGADYSANVLTTATTLCAATNIPYLQNFETSTPPTGFPTCTSMQDVNGNSGPDANITGGRWVTFAGTSGDTYVSPTRVVRYIYDLPNPARPADDWFFIQGLNLQAGTDYRLKFYYKASDGPTWTERIEVKYGTAAHAAAMTNTLFTDNNIDGNLASAWDSAIVDFTPPATDVYYIGFHAISLGDQAFLYMDDVSVRIAPKVDVGVTGITTPNLTCPTNGAFVQATIRNYNTTTLNFAQYPITINANITGASTATLTTTLTTGTLAPGASMTVYLSPAHNFGGGTHNVTVTTVSPDDPETGNDAFTTSISVSPNPTQPVITPASAAICVGNTVQLSTQYTNPPPPPVTLPAVSSGAISVAVPDANAGGTTHSLNVTGVPAGATVTGVSVTLNLTHTWISDMVINLRAPNGSVLNLFNARGGNGDNLVNTVISSASANSLAAGAAPFTGTFAADAAAGVGPTAHASSVTNWAGLYSVGNGNWTLALRDLFAGDLGTLTSWSITISYQMANPVVTWTPNTSLFTNAGATTPYTGGDAFSVYAQPATTTTYTATATNSAGCTSTRTVTVTVNPYPDVTIGNIPDTVCISDDVIQLPATPVGGHWTGIGVSGNTFIPSATAVGTYTLTYSFTSAAGCTSTATTQIAVKDCPERIIRLVDNAVLLYPNPNTGQFNVHINSTSYSYLTMKVYSNTGQLVHTRQLTGLTYGRVIPINLQNLPGGTYMVQFYYDGGVRTSQKTFKVIIGNP